MKYRHELKHEINYCDLLTLRMRLKSVMKPDSHAVNGKYQVHSLYFDNATDKALKEKLDGVNRREKFRIRYYNNDTRKILLEKKSKLNGLGTKESCPLTASEVTRIINNDTNFLAKSPYPLAQELYHKMHSQGLKPKTIVSYTREPFVFAPGNVRVTMDYNIRTSSNCKDFLNEGFSTLPVNQSAIVLEVKWDEFLPDIIKDAVTIPGRRASAFSKYAQCRIYG